MAPLEQTPDEPASSGTEFEQPAYHESRTKDEHGHVFGLRDRDLDDLRRSGLTEETIHTAGIFFVTESVARQLLHRNDLHGDGYAFPYLDFTGCPILQSDGQPYVNIKLDTPPCDKKGRPQKYLKPTGEPNYLYVPPGAADAVCDATRPLLFPEGEKKALKATQEGFPCLALPGVWGFLTRKGLRPGTSLPLPQLDAMLMSGREVFIVFDSDLATNVQVQRAERAFAQYLRTRGAKVYALRLPTGLPGGPTGAKVGLDDFLRALGSAALHALMEQARAEMPCLSPLPGALYRETPQGLFRVKRERDGLTGLVQLTNFTARVVEELQRDDGAEAPVHVLRITGSCQGRPLPPVDVSVAQFASTTWPNEKWGLAPAIFPPSTNKEYVRHALQVLSGDSVQTRRIFTHTGWRRLGETWVYLHAGGGIGMAGVDVELARELARYTLPAIPDDPRAAILRSLAFLDVAPRSVTVPLLASVYLAPLIAALSPKPGFCPFLHGESGTFKTSLACVALSHVGDFATAEALSNFSDTANALERRAFVLKDTLMLIDDFHPSASSHEAQSREMILQRLVRAAGNRTGRARLTSEATERRRYEPRGLVFITGEELPSVQSTLARLLIVDLDRGVVNLKRLTDLQTHALQLRQAMAAYLTHIAPQMETIQAESPARLREIRDRAMSEGQHSRLTESVAMLFYAFHLFLEFTVKIGAVEESAAQNLAHQAWQELLLLARRQGERIQEEDPANRFLEILHALLDSDQVSIKQIGIASAGPCIGVQDEDRVYLFPTETWHAVKEFCRNENTSFPLRPRALYKIMASRGWLQREGQSFLSRATIEGKRRRVLALPAALLLGMRESMEHVP